MEVNFRSTDEQLLCLIERGDQKAFDLLFRRYRNKLFSYLFKITRSQETAEEIVLDVFMKIWTAGGILRTISHFEAFLFRVAYNRAVDFLRKAQRDRQLQKDIYERMIADPSPSLFVEQAILARDMEKTIEEAVKQLSPQRQEVFRLSREEFLTYDEIAERLQLSPVTVRNHMSAALRNIRSKLSGGAAMSTIFLLLSPATEKLF